VALIFGDTSRRIDKTVLIPDEADMEGNKTPTNAGVAFMSAVACAWGWTFAPNMKDDAMSENADMAGNDTAPRDAFARFPPVATNIFVPGAPGSSVQLLALSMAKSSRALRTALGSGGRNIVLRNSAG
jgi:hypothetical protein